MRDRSEADGSGETSVRGFEAAYAELAEAAARYAAVILGPRHRHVLADVLQDVWARAWSAWPPRAMERRDAWLLRIVRNRCLDEHRRSRRRPQQVEAVDDVVALDDPSSAIVAEETLRLLGSLSAPLREALWLRAVEQCSYAEIAELQDVPIGTVMSRLHAARAQLARRLEP